MRLANEIQKKLIGYAKGNSDVIIPNFYFGWNECDLFKITQTDFVVEYEIKISRADFYADFKKQNREGTKHGSLKKGTDKYCPNRFYYVVPEELITIEEIPPYAGLLTYNKYGFFDVRKNAPLLHKRKVDFEIYRDVCRTLSARDLGHRQRIAEIRNTDFDKEMSKMKRELDQVKIENRKLSMRLLIETRDINKAV